MGHPQNLKAKSEVLLSVEEIRRAVLRDGVKRMAVVTPAQAGDSLRPAFVHNRVALQIRDKNTAFRRAFQPRVVERAKGNRRMAMAEFGRERQ